MGKSLKENTRKIFLIIKDQFADFEPPAREQNGPFQILLKLQLKLIHFLKGSISIYQLQELVLRNSVRIYFVRQWIQLKNHYEMLNLIKTVSMKLFLLVDPLEFQKFKNFFKIISMEKN